MYNMYIYIYIYVERYKKYNSIYIYIYVNTYACIICIYIHTRTYTKRIGSDYVICVVCYAV